MAVAREWKKLPSEVEEMTLTDFADCLAWMKIRGEEQEKAEKRAKRKQPRKR